MAHDLSSIFAEQQTNLIDWGGPLYSLYDLPTDATELGIRFVSSTDLPPQGLRLKVRGGTLEIGAATVDDVILWRDLAPKTVRIRVKWKARGARRLRIWNAWRINDVTQAWIGNAGMRVVEEETGLLTLRCSDGEGDPDFEDLVAEVTLTLTGAETPRAPSR